MDYRKTLNLPHTDFPMKANLTQLEPKILSSWKETRVYASLREARKGRKKFILHDGPPYANGLIHIGHALNKILKDIIVKYKFMRGYDCPFIVGWDCHGLPVEHQLFKELNLTKHDIDVLEFRRKAKDFALRFVKLQSEDFQRLGIFSDWENPYLTLEPKYEYAVMKLLERLLEEGYIYRGRKPVNWCANCETALAEAEVEHLDKNSDSIYLLFPLKESEQNRLAGKGGLFSNLEGRGVYFLIWTTTPWTLISNRAVAVHPELDYCLSEYEDKLIIFGTDLAAQLESKLNAKLKVLKTFRGKDLEFLKLDHPFLKRDSLLVLADFVSKDEGSGCVHIAPGHGEEDFSLTKRYPLEIYMPVDDKGVFEEPQEFKGDDINQAGGKVIKILEERGILLRREKITHSYPHCWRCKKPIIFRATSQWFLNVDHNNLRQRVIAHATNVRWVPSSGKERMQAMLSTRPDWCLSRQRLWGVPIPAVKCKKCGEVILDKEVIAKAGEIFKKDGSDSWFSLKLEEFLPAGFTCSGCGKSNSSGPQEFIKENDILDVWFESGASFSAVVKERPQLRFPADMYLEGSDQHRGWFQVSLIPSVALEDTPPFRIILTHGFVVDGEGRKMSKSLGNVIAPQEIIKKYGAEILRLWAAYGNYSDDVRISGDILSQLIDIYRKVRNTLRFILGNIADFNPRFDSVKYSELLEVDRFMLYKTMKLWEEAVASYEEFSFYKVCKKIFNFCNIDLSSFYLDILKDRLYTFSRNSLPRRSAQFVLYHILDVLLKLIAPILSFTAEEVYLLLGDKEKSRSIFFSDLDSSYNSTWVNPGLPECWARLLSLRDNVLKEIEKQRAKGAVGSSLEAKVTLSFKGDNFEFHKKYEEILREILIVSEVEIKEGEFAIGVDKAEGEKCLRCWNRREDVGKSEEFPHLCNRCVNVLRELRKA